MELMRIAKINLASPEDNRRELEAAVQVLKRGGVVMHPTETCYGLAADIFNEKALARLYKLKKMEKLKPVSVMVNSSQMASEYGDLRQGSLQARIAAKYWPGPLTVVVPRKESLPMFLNEGMESVGLRCPACSPCLDLITAFGGPLTTTSANLTQWPEVYEVETYLNQLMDEPMRPDLILDAGLLPKNRPSTIVQFEGAELKLIREGVLWPDIKKFIVRVA